MCSLLAIDLGKVTGWALFKAGTLVACGKVASHALHLLPAADELAIEKPRMRRRHPRPDDILLLAAVMGQIVMLCQTRGAYSISEYYPEQWKGQMPKDACWSRVLKRLTPAEIGVCVNLPGRDVRALPDHNVRDAIGIGLHHLGRGIK